MKRPKPALLKTRWYPYNVKTREVYVGRYHGDQRYGFPTNHHVFEEWHGVRSNVTGIKGDQAERMVKAGKAKLVVRSLYKK